MPTNNNSREITKEDVLKGAEIVASFLPVIGTAMDIRDAIKNPSISTIGQAGLSIASDLSGLSILKGGLKAARYAKKAKKLYKEGHKLYAPVERKVNSLRKTGNPKKIERAERLAKPAVDKWKEAYRYEDKARYERTYNNHSNDREMTLIGADFMTNLLDKTGALAPRYKAGGSTKNKKKLTDDEYYRIMERVAKENWRTWGDDSEDAALTRILNDNSYDYRGYYNKYPNSNANALTHWTDEFKTVYHPTFSNESRYSGYPNKFNPRGVTGGMWGMDEHFIPNITQLINNANMNKKYGSKLISNKRNKLACGGRPRASLGLGLASLGLSTVGNITSSIISANAQREAAEDAIKTQQALNEINSANQTASTINTSLQSNNTINQNYDFDDYIKYRCGGRKKADFGTAFNRLSSMLNMANSLSTPTNAQNQNINNTQGAGMPKMKNGGTKRNKNSKSKIQITDGGVAIPMGNGLSLLRGATHDDINETGQTGIGIQVGRHQIEAQDGEVAQKKKGELRIFSDEPFLNGISPADAVELGYDPDDIFAAQEVYKRMNRITDDGRKYRLGGRRKAVMGIDDDDWTSSYFTQESDATRVNDVTPFNQRNQRTYEGAAYNADSPFDLFEIAAEAIDDARRRSIARSNAKANGTTEDEEYEKILEDESRIVQAGPSIRFTPRNNMRSGMNNSRTQALRNSIRNSMNNNNARYSARQQQKAQDRYNEEGAIGERVSETLKRDDIIRRTGRNNPDDGLWNRGEVPEGSLKLRSRVGYALEDMAAKASNVGRTVREQVYNTVRSANNRIKSATERAAEWRQAQERKIQQRRTERAERRAERENQRNNNENASNNSNNNSNSNSNSNSSNNSNNSNSEQTKKKFHVGKKTKIGLVVGGGLTAAGGLTGLRFAKDASDYGINDDNDYGYSDLQRAITAARIKNIKNSNNSQASRQNSDTANKQNVSNNSSNNSNNNSNSNNNNSNRSTNSSTSTAARTNNASNNRSTPSSQRRNTSTSSNSNNSQASRQNSKASTSLANKIPKFVAPNTVRKTTPRSVDYRSLNDNAIRQMISEITQQPVERQLNDREKLNFYREYVIANNHYNELVAAGKLENKNKRSRRDFSNPKSNFRYRKNRQKAVWGTWDYYLQDDDDDNDNSNDYGASFAIEDYEYPIWVRSLTNGVDADDVVSSINNGINLNASNYGGSALGTYGNLGGYSNLGGYINGSTGNNSSDVDLDAYDKKAKKQDKWGMDVRKSDWLGLGADLLGSVGGSLLNYALLNGLNIDYMIPQYVAEVPVAFDTTYHNGAQRANVERNRINARNTIGRNTASANRAVRRMQESDTNAMMQQNVLWDEKANKEAELRNEQARNTQEVRARNTAAQNEHFKQVAEIKNAEQDTKNQLKLAKANALTSSLTGLTDSVNNFITSARTRYEDNQSQLATMAAGQPGSVARMLASGYGDDQLAYRLYRMNQANAVEKPIAPDISNYDMTTESGRQQYNAALQQYNSALTPYNDWNSINELALRRMAGYRLGGKINRRKLSLMR